MLNEHEFCMYDVTRNGFVGSAVVVLIYQEMKILLIQLRQYSYAINPNKYCWKLWNVYKFDGKRKGGINHINWWHTWYLEKIRVFLSFFFNRTGKWFSYICRRRYIVLKHFVHYHWISFQICGQIIFTGLEDVNSLRNIFKYKSLVK